MVKKVAIFFEKKKKEKKIIQPFKSMGLSPLMPGGNKKVTHT